MRFPQDNEEEHFRNEGSHETEFLNDEPLEKAHHRRLVRKRLEAKLERKRLREELEDFNEDFDWDELER